jgi:hypothetical protein
MAAVVFVVAVADTALVVVFVVGGGVVVGGDVDMVAARRWRGMVVIARLRAW